MPGHPGYRTLPFAVLLITGGRLGDRYGRKRVFMLGMLGFAAGSLACALAPSIDVLVAARVVQGAAAAAVIPQTFGLITAMFTGTELARALSGIGPTMGLAAVCGPVLGAAITQADLAGTSWRAAFLVNVPLAAAVLLVAPALREDRAERAPRLDLPGTVLAILGIGLLTYPLIEAAPLGTTAVLLGAGAASLLGFVGWQRRSARRGGATLVEVSLFTGRAFPTSLVASTLFFAVMNGVMLVLVVHEQVGLHRDVLAAGLTVLPWSAGSATASLLAGIVLVPRFGTRIAPLGLGVLAVGLAAVGLACWVDPTGSGPALPGALVLAGLGLGLFTVPFFTAALSQVAPQQTGSAAGLLNAVQQLGATWGVALLPTVYLGRLSTRIDTATDTTAAIVVTLAVALVLVAGAAVATRLMHPPRTASHQAVGA